MLGLVNYNEREERCGWSIMEGEILQQWRKTCYGRQQRRKECYGWSTMEGGGTIIAEAPAAVREGAEGY